MEKKDPKPKKEEPKFDHEFEKIIEKMHENPVMILSSCQRHAKGKKGLDYLKEVNMCLTAYIKQREK